VACRAFWWRLFDVLVNLFVFVLACAWCHNELLWLILPFAPHRSNGELHLFNSYQYGS